MVDIVRVCNAQLLIIVSYSPLMLYGARLKCESAGSPARCLIPDAPSRVESRDGAVAGALCRNCIYRQPVARWFRLWVVSHVKRRASLSHTRRLGEKGATSDRKGEGELSLKHKTCTTLFATITTTTAHSYKSSERCSNIDVHVPRTKLCPVLPPFSCNSLQLLPIMARSHVKYRPRRKPFTTKMFLALLT
jgi:hypothetical protein